MKSPNQLQKCTTHQLSKQLPSLTVATKCQQRLMPQTSKQFKQIRGRLHIPSQRHQVMDSKGTKDLYAPVKSF